MWRFFLPLHFTLYTNVSFIKIAVSFPFLIPCLKTPTEHRENSEGTPTELLNYKKQFSCDWLPKKVDSLSEEVD